MTLQTQSAVRICLALLAMGISARAADFSVNDYGAKGDGVAIDTAAIQKTTYPDYWKILTAPVPPAQGLPHLRNITISDIKATGARNAFPVASYKDSPLSNVKFRNFDVESRVAGAIANAENRTFTNTHIQTADGSAVTVKDSDKVIGLPAK